MPVVHGEGVGFEEAPEAHAGLQAGLCHELVGVLGDGHGVGVSGGAEVFKDTRGGAVVVGGLVGSVDAVEARLPVGEVDVFGVCADTRQHVEFRKGAERRRKVGHKVLVEQNGVAFQERGVEEILLLKAPTAFETVGEFLRGVAQNAEAQTVFRTGYLRHGVLAVGGEFFQLPGQSRV